MAVRHVHLPAVVKGHLRDSDLVLYGSDGQLQPTLGPLDPTGLASTMNLPPPAAPRNRPISLNKLVMAGPLWTSQ